MLSGAATAVVQPREGGSGARRGAVNEWRREQVQDLPVRWRWRPLRKETAVKGDINLCSMNIGRMGAGETENIDEE